MDNEMDSPLAYYNYLTKRNRISFFVRQFFINDLTRHLTGKVLDIGCGIGEFLSAYPESIGLDYNPFLVKHCIQQGLTCHLASSYNLPFPDCWFDGILISNVLEHLHEAEVVVAEAVRVLKPGGLLVVTVPMDAGFQHDSTHVRMFRKVDLQTLAKGNGLQVKTVYGYPLNSDWLGKYLYFFELRAIFVKNNHLSNSKK